MDQDESPGNKNRDSGTLDITAALRDLPERYFQLMTSGGQLAKQGAFKEAVKQFADARIEGSRIIRRLLELPKSSHALTWQIFAILWAFKLIKCVFYWILSRSEAAKTHDERKELLMAAAGAQMVGRDLITSFETLDKVLEGVDRDLLPLLSEAIRNFEDRQRFLEQALREQKIDPKTFLTE